MTETNPKKQTSSPVNSNNRRENPYAVAPSSRNDAAGFEVQHFLELFEINQKPGKNGKYINAFYYAIFLPVVILCDMSDKADICDRTRPGECTKNPKMPLSKVLEPFFDCLAVPDENKLTPFGGVNDAAPSNFLQRLDNLCHFNQHTSAKDYIGAIAKIGYNVSGNLRRDLIDSSNNKQKTELDLDAIDIPIRNKYERGTGFSNKLKQLGKAFDKLIQTDGDNPGENRNALFQYYLHLMTLVFCDDDNQYGLSADDRYFNCVNQNLNRMAADLGINKNPYRRKIEKLAYLVYLLVTYLIAKDAKKDHRELLFETDRIPGKLLFDESAANDFLAVLENYPAESIERFSALHDLYILRGNCYAAHELMGTFRLGAVLHDACGAKTYRMEADSEMARSILRKLEENRAGYLEHAALFRLHKQTLEDDFDCFEPDQTLPYHAEKLLTAENKAEALRAANDYCYDASVNFSPSVYYAMEQLTSPAEFKAYDCEVRSSEMTKWFFDLFRIIEDETAASATGKPAAENVIFSLFRLYGDAPDVLEGILRGFPKKDLTAALSEADAFMKKSAHQSDYLGVAKWSVICNKLRELTL